MTKKERINEIVRILNEEYGTEVTHYLNFNNAWELLVATILSAQCTDARVNIVTKDLFVKYPDAYALAKANQEELEQDIFSTGFYKNKAKNLIACANEVIDKYGGEVPSDIDKLTKLPGVGRKIANLIIGDIYGKPAVVADTHCIRISGRLGFTPEGEKSPVKVEMALKKYLPEKEQSDFCHRIVQFGREVCSARSPKCDGCFLADLCKSRIK